MPAAAPEFSEAVGVVDASNGNRAAPAAVKGPTEGEGWSTASEDGWEGEEAASSSGVSFWPCPRWRSLAALYIDGIAWFLRDVESNERHTQGMQRGAI